MVGLTRFLFLMNLCEKNAVLLNVYNSFVLSKKDVDFRGVKILFVLQGMRANGRAFCIRGCNLPSEFLWFPMLSFRFQRVRVKMIDLAFLWFALGGISRFHRVEAI